MQNNQPGFFFGSDHWSPWPNMPLKNGPFWSRSCFPKMNFSGGGIGMFPKLGGFPPQIIHFSRFFHYKPSIVGYPKFWKHSYGNCGSMKFIIFLGEGPRLARHMGASKKCVCFFPELIHNLLADTTPKELRAETIERKHPERKVVSFLGRAPPFTIWTIWTI